MKQLFSTLSHSTRRYLAALTLLFLFSACTQTPTPNNDQNNPIEISDEEGNNLTAQAVPTNGLKGDYYNNIDFTGTLKTRYDANVNRNWGTAAPISGIANTTYSVRWTGQILPQYSQEYTFFVTSSGGARLMVNGQALVNNWTDHTSKVDSGKVTLQANVKYDIRLEFFRNTSNPAMIKLEWQSASRTKQVVPQARLYPTGSNAAKAITAIAARFNLNLNVQESVLIQSKSQAATLIAPEVGSSNLVFSVIDGDTVALLYKLEKVGIKWTISNLLDNTSADLGEARQFVNDNGTQSEAQRIALRLKLLEYVTKKFINANISAQNTQLRPQSVLQDILCPIPSFFLRPPTCGLDDCDGKVNDFLTTACNLIFIPARLFELVLAVASTTVPPAWAITGVLIVENSDIAGDVTGSLFNGNQIEFFNLVAKWQAYLKCLADHPITCIRELTPIPASERNVVNATGFLHPGVRNSGQDTANGKAVNIIITKREFVPETVGFTSLSISFISNTLSPNEEDTLNLVYTCPSTPQTIRGKAKFWHDVTNLPNPIEALVSVECYGEPKLTANSLTLAALLNSSAEGKITVKNDGEADLNITQSSFVFTKSIPEALLSIPNFANTTLAPGATKDFPVTGTCKTTAGILEGELTLISNDPTSPKVLTVTLNCVGGIVHKMQFGFMGWDSTSEFGGYATGCGGYQIVSYDIRVYNRFSGLVSYEKGFEKGFGNFCTSTFSPTWQQLVEQAKEKGRIAFAGAYQKWQESEGSAYAWYGNGHWEECSSGNKVICYFVDYVMK